jgi:transcriptional regulator with XRE-family HTH domain
MGNKISYNMGMKKNYFTKQAGDMFKSTKDLQEWLSNHPDYKDQIKIIREVLGMTQEQLAKKVDRTPRSIRTIENGEAFPRITTLQKIADALNAELKISLIPKEAIPGFLFEKTNQGATEFIELNNTDSSFEMQSPTFEGTDIEFGEND